MTVAAACGVQVSLEEAARLRGAWQGEIPSEAGPQPPAVALDVRGGVSSETYDFPLERLLARPLESLRWDPPLIEVLLPGRGGGALLELELDGEQLAGDLYLRAEHLPVQLDGIGYQSQRRTEGWDKP